LLSYNNSYLRHTSNEKWKRPNLIGLNGALTTPPNVSKPWNVSSETNPHPRAFLLSTHGTRGRTHAPTMEMGVAAAKDLVRRTTVSNPSLSFVSYHPRTLLTYVEKSPLVTT